MPPFVLEIRHIEDVRDVVHQTVQALAEGGLVALPTETVYGLAASAINAEAVDRLLQAKGRPTGQPLTLALKSADDALDYVPRMTPLARRLARRCWPGPLTLVVDDEESDSLLGQLPASVRQAVVPAGTIGLRVPAHPMILDVLRMLTGPVVLTSANRSGEPAAVNADEVVRQLGDDVALILDDGPSHYGQPSSVVRVDGDRYEILREGVVTDAALQRLASFMAVLVCTGNTCRSPMAEASLRRRLADRVGCKIEELEDRGIVVESAGVAAGRGAPATTEAHHAMREMGLNLTEHSSQPLTEQLVRNADVVLAMTRAHREAIVTHWPDSAERVHLLRHDGNDVADPIGGSRDVYLDCAKQIDTELAAWAQEIELT